MSEQDAIIIGGGPAGSSAAIRLAENGLRVLLLEERHLPRHKLCGEFITAESFPTLRRLKVMESMLEAGAQKIRRLTLSAPTGRAVHMTIAEMSDESSWAMSLSRARFDKILLDRARVAGARCLEGVVVKGCAQGQDSSHVVEAISLSDGSVGDYRAPIVIDASGRNSRLMVGRTERVGGRRGSRLYAMKAHLEGVEGIDEQVELYFFPQGYGGLSRVEDGLVNLCFIVNERDVRAAGGDASKVVEQTVKNNRLARSRLSRFTVAGKWQTAGPLTFGTRRLSRGGVLAVGDASGMIDPFTGTGMQIALRTGELAAESIIEALGSSGNFGSGRGNPFDKALALYRARYENEFGKRMKAAGLLRAVAFSPSTANFFAGVLARAPWLARRVLRSTRSGRPKTGRGSSR
ncbi:MAG TPA: NAD(P)/FAD-dependent oxidoreductase [Blastocatellia bacterium]|nr:NAD(P)/FAD-dependent oxidoreductase [Blastocatellia bacterium]